MKYSSTTSCALLFYSLLASTSTNRYLCLSKEIVATNDWQKVEEGDSIPKGLHVKMNFETGEKWVKLLDDNYDENKLESNSIIYTVDGNLLSPESSAEGVKITHLESNHISPDASARIQEHFLKEAQRKKNVIESISKLNDFKSDMSIDELDYQTMYRTLLKLPDEEKASIQDFPTEPTENDTPEAKEHFEATVRKIWASRQALLKQMEDEYLADVTDIMQHHVYSLQEYIMHPVQGIMKVLGDQNRSNATEEYDQGSEALNIVEVLEDLEFQLTDLDNARDFYSMGGWPFLVSLVTDSLHGVDNLVQQTVSTKGSDMSDYIQVSNEQIEFLTQIQRISWRIQGLAAWCIGTAVKNTEEFFPWALEDFSELVRNNYESTNVLTILLEKFEKESAQASLGLRSDPYDEVFQMKRKLELYALGSLLRGNRGAIAFFVKAGGPRVLQNMYDAIALSAMTTEQLLDRNNIAIVTKIIAIFDDLITDATAQSSQNENDNTLNEELLAAFTTSEWCKIPLSALNIPSFHIRLKILDTIMHMGHLCKYNSSVLDDIRSKITGSNDGSDEEDNILALLDKLRQVLI